MIWESFETSLIRPGTHNRENYSGSLSVPLDHHCSSSSAKSLPLNHDLGTKRTLVRQKCIPFPVSSTRFTCVVLVLTKIHHGLECWIVPCLRMIRHGINLSAYLSVPGRGIASFILKSDEFFLGWNLAKVVLSILKVMAVTIPARPKHPETVASFSLSSTVWSSPFALTNSSLSGQ